MKFHPMLGLYMIFRMGPGRKLSYFPYQDVVELQVPGPDGKLGFGGACFPKDLSALINFAEEEGEILELLKSVRTINNKIRSNYKGLELREREQIRAWGHAPRPAPFQPDPAGPGLTSFTPTPTLRPNTGCAK